MKDERTLKVEGCFGAHAEKKIENAEVGQESMTLLIDLPIGFTIDRFTIYDLPDSVFR